MIKVLNQEQKKQESNFVDTGIIPVQEITDIAATIKEMNDDSIKDRFSNIDMKARLASIEISSIIALDALIALNFLPIETGVISRSKKRLSVSLNGKGREEIVQIANGLNQQNQSKSLLDRFGSMFGAK